MQEPTISELVKIESGYTSYVNIRQELFDDAQNIGRMERYRPITSHRQAFQALAKSQQIKDGRCYLLTGSYGTGKSHLCLMFANYLQTPAEVPPMPRFFDNYREADPHEANTLQAYRGSGRYLVALCQYGGKEDFDELILKAVDEALKRENFNEDFDTQYLQALKKIEAWETLAGGGNVRFREEFERELADANAGLTVNAFKKRLRDYDLPALQEFKRIHIKITTSPFTYDRSDLIEILTSTLASARFKERFLGLLVLFDEFGDTMEHGRLSPKAFQKLAELCAEPPVGCARLVFVGTAHKNLADYARSYNQLDFRTASDRIKQVPLTPDGVEEIISAIVIPQKKHPLWQKVIEPRSDVFDSFGQDCTRLKLFDWLSAPKVRTKIIENIYPMHPMATFALLQLTRDVASNNRSVYTFFSEDAPGSYPDFIRDAPLLEQERLNLYTVDRLCDYFGDTLKSDNKELRDTVRDRIRDYENTLRALNQLANADDLESFQFKGDLLILRLLRVMLVYEIIGKQNRIDNLRFGLYVSTQAEKEELKNRLESLVSKGILYYARDTGIYEFRHASAVNFDVLIETYLKDPAHVPQNLVAELESLVPLEKKDLYLEAKNYNLQYSEDKQLLRRFVRSADLGTIEETPQGKRDFFQKLEEEITLSIAKKNEHEGMALYVICETADEISKAKDFCSRNNSQRIVVGIPKQPVPLTDAVMEYRALQSIEQSEDFSNFSTQDKAAYNTRLNGDQNRAGAKQTLMKLRDKLLNVKEIAWQGKYAQTLATDDTKPYDAADRVIEQIYTERNRFSHEDFNKLHTRVDKTKSQPLKEAVEKLLDYSEQVVIHKDLPQQRGDYRYLDRCLLQNGVLVQVKAEGYKLRCDFEENVAQFSGKLPALAEMICELRSLENDGKIRLVEWVQRYRCAPYGQGMVGLALCLACLRRHFRDSIRFKVDENALGDMPVKSLDDLLRLLDGTCPNAFISYRPLSSYEKSVINEVYCLFGTPDNAVVKDYTVVEAHVALRNWWEGLPPVARIAKLYSTEAGAVTTFTAALEKVAGRDAHAFLFEELPTAVGLDGGLAVTQQLVDTLKTELPKMKALLEARLSRIESRVIEGVQDLFGIEQNTYSDILEGIRQWFHSLDSVQRDPFSKWHNGLSKAIVVQFKAMTDLPCTLLIDLPKVPEYGGRAVRDWSKDSTNEYLGLLKTGKERIEANRIKVEPPHLEPTGNFEWPEGGQLSFKDRVHLTFKAAKSGVKIYVTEGGAEPTDPSAIRQEVNGTEPILISANKTLLYAAQDAEGNWSPVQRVRLTNANREFIPAVGEANLYGQRAVQFNFPKDQATLKVACRELFQQCLTLGIVDDEQLEIAVMEALKEAITLQ